MVGLTMFAELFTMIRDDEDERPVEVTALAQGPEEPAELRVELANSGVHARFRIITPEEHVEKFFGLPQTDVLHSISDDELLHEYRRAHALFLPLNLSTANNAILEAMACGTPVITTRTGGIPEYAEGDGSIMLEPGDVDGAVAALRQIAEHRDLVDTMGTAARARAEEQAEDPL